MNTPSFWSETVSLPSYKKLDRDLHVDLVVVGGGITGITTAYLATKAGYSVALLERRRIGASQERGRAENPDRAVIASRDGGDLEMDRGETPWVNGRM